MRDLPKILKSGVEARLIPTVADSNKEERTASVLLAALAAVPCYRKALLSTIGKYVGSSARVNCYTEVNFIQTPEDIANKRPDGLIVVTVGKNVWTAIVEVKINKNKLNSDQLKSYLFLAKMNGIDAVITVSNEFVGHPSHHPLKIGTRDRRGVDLFHWSWMMVRTMALLSLNEDEFDNYEQRWILREVARYLEHDSSGILGFSQMNPEWKDVVIAFHNDIGLRPKSQEIQNTIASWHQERRDLCLLMSRELGQQVQGKMSSAHRKDPLKRLKDDGETLVKTAKLSCTLKVVGAADMEVVADLRARTMSCTMRFRAPTDRKRPSARINWLLRQLSKTEDENVMVIAHWPGRMRLTRATLKELRASGGTDPLIRTGDARPPHSFDVSMVRDLGGRFARRSVFIDEIEKLVPEFYSEVGQHVTPFQEAPPKRADRTTVAQEAEVHPEADEEASANVRPSSDSADTDASHVSVRESVRPPPPRSWRL
ncbi:MAG: hypothetical protein ACE5H8_08665 [Alphaproteobacteria bacterium]